jgi:hypothetical protein
MVHFFSRSVLRCAAHIEGGHGTLDYKVGAFVCLIPRTGPASR